MPYKLRFVQRFMIKNSSEFLELEKQFAEMETTYKDMPKGKRYIPHAGQHSTNTIIWESDFETLDELNKAHSIIKNLDEHEDLFKEQAQYMIDSYTEIYVPYDE